MGIWDIYWRADSDEQFLSQGMLLTWLKLFVHHTLRPRRWQRGCRGLVTLASSHWLQVKSYKITNPEMLFHFNWTFRSECRSQFVLIIIANMKMTECFSDGVFNHHSSKKWSHWMNYWSEVWTLIIRLSVLTGDSDRAGTGLGSA